MMGDFQVALLKIAVVTDRFGRPLMIVPLPAPPSLPVQPESEAGHAEAAGPIVE